MNKDTQILFIINHLDFGGAGKMLKYVANLCADNFDNVAILSLYEKERSKGVSDKLKFYSLENDSKGGLLWRLAIIRSLRKKIKEINPDVVCTFVSDACFTTRVATLGMNVKVVSAERGDPYTLGRVWTALMKWTYGKSDYCFFQLEKARDFFGPKVAKKSFVIPNVFVQDTGVTPFYGERKKTIVSAGRFVAEKRYEVLIEAFAKVHASHPEYSMIIYGEGPFIDKYKQKSDTLGISEYITYPGYVKGVAKAVREEGIFVLPSLYEGIPNSLIEALSVGIPCVSTNCTPGGPEFLTKGGTTGVLVPVNNVEAMSNAILRIIESPELAKELSQKGPSILEELTDEKISKQWIAAFKQIFG